MFIFVQFPPSVLLVRWKTKGAEDENETNFGLWYGFRVESGSFAGAMVPACSTKAMHMFASHHFTPSYPNIPHTWCIAYVIIDLLIDLIRPQYIGVHSGQGPGRHAPISPCPPCISLPRCSSAIFFFTAASSTCLTTCSEKP